MNTSTGEWVSRRYAEELRAVEPDQRLGHLTGAWTSELARGVPDLDRLMTFGQVARQDEVAGVEEALVNWLGRKVNRQRVEVGACFLLGLWPRRQPDPRLMECLANALGTATSIDDTDRAIVVALGQVANSLPAEQRSAVAAVCRSNRGELERGGPLVRVMVAGLLEEGRPTARCEGRGRESMAPTREDDLSGLDRLERLGLLHLKDKPEELRAELERRRKVYDARADAWEKERQRRRAAAKANKDGAGRPGE